MDSTLLGLILDSSVLIAAERRKLTPEQAIETVRKTVGEIPIILCSLTIAEIGHGIYRANTPEIRDRRRTFLDELKATVPIHPITEARAEIVARIGGEEAARGINLPLGDLIIGACALELGYAVGTSNVEDFARIPGLSVVSL
jgi:predicted nucleic acid-binding protein